MRPANLLAKEMSRFSSSVVIRHGEKEANGKSIVSIMASGIGPSAEITVECRGEDEAEMLHAAESILLNGIGELC